ncbi:hypothetical protein PGK08_002860 [Acinetobacter baumannii]
MGFFISKYSFKVVRVGSAPLILISIIAYFIVFLIFQNSLPEYIFTIKSSELLVSYLFLNTGIFLGAFYQQVTTNEDIVNEDILLYGGTIQMQFIKYKKEVIYASSFFLIILFFMQPMYFGKVEAKKILNDKEIYLSKALLKDSIKEWYLIESMGDKV